MHVMVIWNKALKIMRGKSIRHCMIDKTSKIQSGSNIIDSTFGRYSFCGYDCTIVNCDIGSFTSIADNVSIGDASHPMDWVSMSPVFYQGRDIIKKKFSTHPLLPISRTIIGNDVWIGKGALIKSGILIGDGAVIGMGSIVTKNVEPYSIVEGSPAKFIRKRFIDSTIEGLQKSEWWNYSDQDLNEFAQYFTNPEIFLKMKENKIGQGK